MMFVRYRAVEPNRRNVRVGVFALVNGLSAEGRLDPVEETWRREANAWYGETCPDPSSRDPSVYDRQINPGAVAWFKESASMMLLSRIAPYLDLLDAHGVAWERVVSDAPGHVVYEDDVQVVVVPW